MVKYSMLEFYSKNGNRLELGIFKAESIPKIVEEYMQYEGFNNKISVFIADKSCYIYKGQKIAIIVTTALYLIVDFYLVFCCIQIIFE